MKTLIQQLVLALSLFVLSVQATNTVKAHQSSVQVTTFKAALELANAGNAAEVYNVAYYYQTGYGVQKNEQEARKWFKRAEQTQSGSVHYKLGRLIETGLFFEANIKKALAHYQYAAKAGDPYGMNNFGSHLISGQFIMQNDTEGVMWLEKSANLGMTEAMLNLAEYYREQKQLTNTILWLTKAAKANNIDGMVKLAKIYLTEKDYHNALLWFKAAANKDNDEAQLYMAMMTDKGLGIERSAIDARSWLEKSAQGGNQKAKRILAKNSEKKQAQN